MSDWTVPAPLVDAAAQAMGEIDCMARPGGRWHGRLFMFVRQRADVVRLLSTCAVAEWCVLAHNATDSRRCQLLMRQCTALCFIAGRVTFIDASGGPAHPLQGQIMFYRGPHRERFIEALAPFGVPGS